MSSWALHGNLPGWPCSDYIIQGVIPPSHELTSQDGCCAGSARSAFLRVNERAFLHAGASHISCGKGKMSARKPAGTSDVRFCDQFNEKVELTRVVQIQATSGAPTADGSLF